MFSNLQRLLCSKIKRKTMGATMDHDSSGAREAQVAAYAVAFLFLSMMGLFAVSETRNPPGNPYVTMASLNSDY